MNPHDQRPGVHPVISAIAVTVFVVSLLILIVLIAR
jgi:hypothetical protein